ncbi:MAG: hypothetical protein KTR31_08815 [Myxococcales bacterium]|nr:hypothetical protein [Myxococcales bacterium]
MVQAAQSVHEVHEAESSPPITVPDRQPGKSHRGFAIGILVAGQLAPMLAFLLAMSFLYGGPGTGPMWLMVAGVLPVAAAVFGFALFLAEGEPG